MKLGELIEMQRNKERNVYIWGASNMGCAIFKKIKTYGHVAGFVDNSCDLWGHTIDGYRVCRPEDIAASNMEPKPFILFSMLGISDALHKQCREMGYRFREDYDFLEDQYSYFIDVAGACNLRCPTCVRGNAPAHLQPPRAMMAVETFERVIRKIKAETPQAMCVSLFNNGEPFLHPDLDKLVRICRENDLFCILSSNFSIEGSIDQAVKANPDWLKVSLSGFRQDVYQTTHTGGYIDLVKSNLYRLRYLIDRYQLGTIVELGYHLYRNNRDEDLAEMRRMAKDLGFNLRTVTAGYAPLEKLIDICKGERLDDSMEKLLIDGAKVPKTYREAAEGDARECSYAVKQIAINADCSVFPCCLPALSQNLLPDTDYLRDSMETIFAKKKSLAICRECREYGFIQ